MRKNVQGIAILLFLLISATACTPAFTAKPAAPPTALVEPVTPVVETISTSNPFYNQEGGIEFERISLEQGLSQSSVECVFQDSRGFMWFGTSEGLNKYDGYRFTVYKNDPEDPHSLSDNIVQSLVEDNSGMLWIGTDEGLNRFDPITEQFNRYKHDPTDPYSLSSNRILSLYQDNSGALWVGTDGGGLDRFENGQFIHHRHDDGDPHSLSNNIIRAIHQDQEGMLWIGTGGGLDKLDPDTGRFTFYRHDSSDPHSLSNDIVLSLYQDQEGVLWVGTGGGLNRFERHGEQFSHYRHDPQDTHSLSDNIIRSIHQDRDGDLWIGTNDQGLDRFNSSTERFTHYQNDLGDPNSLSSNQVLSIYQDRSGVLWIGTRGGGVNKFDRSRNRFFHFQNDPKSENSLNDNNVWAIHQDRDGILWIGTGTGGLNRYDVASGIFKSYSYTPNNPDALQEKSVYAILQDMSGRLWVGTDRGLYTFYEDTETFRFWTSRKLVSSIYEDGDQVLWVGSQDGLGRFNQDRSVLTDYRHDKDDPHSLSSNSVLSIYRDRSGVLWVGTDNGLNRLDQERGEFVRYQHDPDDPNSLSDNIVLAVYQDRAGTLWIGTYGGGLDRFEKETEIFTRYREKDGLPSDAIYGILEDSGGNLWLSTNKGLSRFNPRKESFKNYDASDGLQSNEFNQGAFNKGVNGEMFFGGINGFNAFYPDKIVENSFIPPLVLVSLTQSGESVDLGQSADSIKEVSFNWPNNFFEFEFAALNYIQPEKNQYAYMLEKLDKDWIHTGTRRFGRYTNLSGGRYTLRIIASNNDGVWNREGLSIKVTIVPPFWQTWWFRGLLALLLVGGVLIGYRWRTKSIEARNMELETLVQERTREIERRRQELEALYRADAELFRYLRLDEVLQALVDIAVDILQAEKSSLMVWDERQEKMIARAARGFGPETMAQMIFTPGEGTVGHVAATGEPVIVEDANTDSRVSRQPAITEREGIRSFMLMPIKIEGKVFGVFSADYMQPRAFGQDEQRLFTALTQRAALAVDAAQLYEQAQQLLVVKERNRLARDLHDAVTQTLFSASLIAEVVPTVWASDQQEGQQLLEELRQLSRGALAEMRTLLLELRPTALLETSLRELLRQLAETVTGRKGVPVTVTVKGRCALPGNLHIALYRIAQEALNNVIKHARAGRVEVSLHCIPFADGGEEAVSVELCICDDGRGFDLDEIPPDCLGLGIMRERAQTAGASLEIDSRPGRGTQITVVWKGASQ